MIEYKRFAVAKELVEHGDMVAGLSILMKLALHARQKAMRGWAARYLLTELNIRVVGTEDETQSTTSRLR